MCELAAKQRKGYGKHPEKDIDGFFYSGLGDGHSVLILAQSLWIEGVLEQKAFGSYICFCGRGFGEGEERNASNGIASHGNRQHLGVA